MKKLFSVILATLFVLGLAACGGKGDEKEKLAVPQNVAISDAGVITWSAVEHATGYVVIIDGTEYTVTETQYTVSDLTKNFTYSVYATAEGYTSSDASEQKTYTVLTPPSTSGVTVTVTGVGGKNWLGEGKTLQLTARVTGASDTSVTWSVERGDAVTVSSSGLVTAKELDGDATVIVRATSKQDPTVYGSITLTVRAKTELTQEMLDDAASSTVEFSGWVEVRAYSVGMFSRLVESYNLDVYTSMDGTHWYTRYENGSTGLEQSLYYSDHEGLACEVGLSLSNEEFYYPTHGRNGEVISWEDSGLYNNFIGLKVSDFTFNEENFRYEYTGSDANLAEKMVASANPYEFRPKNFALLIEDGILLGFTSDSEDDYSVVPGYRSEMTLVVNYNTQNVEVPTVTKLEHNAELHDPLQAAIDKMKTVTSYDLEFRHISQSIYASGVTYTGWHETVTADTCDIKAFNVRAENEDNTIDVEYTGEEYGYKKISDSLYNMFYAVYGEAEGGQDGEKSFVASRAFEGDFADAKPGFNFSADLFFSKTTEGNEDTYFAYEEVSNVATEFYRGVGNDDALYGIFATPLLMDSQPLYSWVTVDNTTGYIVDSGFSYNMGLMYGVVTIYYSNFNTAEVDEPVEFEAREIPTSWNELTVIDTRHGDEVETNAYTFMADYLGSTANADLVPFFGEVLGDVYGFGMVTSYDGRGVLSMYYDVPLDMNYTITSSIDTVAEFLRENGFTMPEGQTYYRKGGVCIALVDSDLDFMIQIWSVSGAI